jgi:hypothetical protein
MALWNLAACQVVFSSDSLFVLSFVVDTVEDSSWKGMLTHILHSEMIRSSHQSWHGTSLCLGYILYPLKLHSLALVVVVAIRDKP